MRIEPITSRRHLASIHSYTVETYNNSTRTITDSETSIRAAKETARHRRNDSTGGGGNCTIYRDGIAILAWREWPDGWKRAEL
jgi:hypothetical protein